MKGVEYWANKNRAIDTFVLELFIFTLVCLSSFKIVEVLVFISRSTPVTSASTNSKSSTDTKKGDSSEGSSKEITALRRAILGQESGGNSRAVNPHSGALGYGQLMPYNVRPWTRAALGRELSPTEFLNSPDLQIKTIDFKLNEYFQEGLREAGSKEEAVRWVAAKWYSGQGKKKDNCADQYYNG